MNRLPSVFCWRHLSVCPFYRPSRWLYCLNECSSPYPEKRSEMLVQVLVLVLVLVLVQEEEKEEGV